MNKHLRDFLRHRSVLVMSLLELACIALVLPTLGSGHSWLAILIGAILFWASEYTTHRFLFHAPPTRHPFLLRLQKKLHYDHHEFPQDLDLLFLPVWYSIPNYGLVWLISFALTRNPVLATAVVVGALASLLYYEWVHFVAHRAIKPRTAWGRYQKKVHLWHHFKNENYWFGVTNSGMDHLLGTFHDASSVELSPTARNLHQTQGNQQLPL